MCGDEEASELQVMCTGFLANGQLNEERSQDILKTEALSKSEEVFWLDREKMFWELNYGLGVCVPKQAIFNIIFHFLKNALIKAFPFGPPLVSLSVIVSG